MERRVCGEGEVKGQPWVSWNTGISILWYPQIKSTHGDSFSNGKAATNVIYFCTTARGEKNVKRWSSYLFRSTSLSVTNGIKCPKSESVQSCLKSLVLS